MRINLGKVPVQEAISILSVLACVTGDDGKHPGIELLTNRILRQLSTRAQSTADNISTVGQIDFL